MMVKIRCRSPHGVFVRSPHGVFDAACGPIGGVVIITYAKTQSFTYTREGPGIGLTNDRKAFTETLNRIKAMREADGGVTPVIGRAALIQFPAEGPPFDRVSIGGVVGSTPLFYRQDMRHPVTGDTIFISFVELIDNIWQESSDRPTVIDTVVLARTIVDFGTTNYDRSLFDALDDFVALLELKKGSQIVGGSNPITLDAEATITFELYGGPDDRRSDDRWIAFTTDVLDELFPVPTP